MKTSPLLVGLVGIVVGLRYFIFQRYGEPSKRNKVLLSLLGAAISGVAVFGLWGAFSN